MGKSIEVCVFKTLGRGAGGRGANGRGGRVAVRGARTGRSGGSALCDRWWRQALCHAKRLRLCVLRLRGFHRPRTHRSRALLPSLSRQHDRRGGGRRSRLGRSEDRRPLSEQSRCFTWVSSNVQRQST